jgi:NAD+ synthase (glutamine-hydrolysing)
MPEDSFVLWDIEVLIVPLQRYRQDFIIYREINMKNTTIRVACSQINTTVGDLEGNKLKILQAFEGARTAAADLAVFPELCLTGYPPEDLLLKPKFVSDNLAILSDMARSMNDMAAVVGFVDRKGKNLYNAAAVIYNGHVCAVYHKIFLPNYGVFDENRYFKAGEKPLVFAVGPFVIGTAICEDIWHKEGPVKEQAALGAQLIATLHASPYYMGKIIERQKIARTLARDTGVVICYANGVGGQDELVFDGQSMVIDSRGRIVRRAPAFKEHLLVSDVSLSVAKAKHGKNIVQLDSGYTPKKKPALAKRDFEPLEPVEEVYQALVLGIRDYVNKNGFKKVVIGLSGGVDSALVAALAVDALGKDNVTGIFMPSRYSSQESETDAQLTANNLGIEFRNISIEHIYKMYLLVFEPHFVGMPKDIAEENLQARIRGNVLMAFANKFGWMVLTTGNKSEMSAGYATLYGDMAGGLAAIKDVPKTLVYDLCRFRNSGNSVIPERVLTKAPTAELKPNQKDTDTLPPYDVLDPIVKAYVEEDKHIKEIVGLGFDEQTVKRVLALVDKSEYKRRQSPPGIKITPRAFGRDRRMPITNRYSEFTY